MSYYCINDILMRYVVLLWSTASIVLLKGAASDVLPDV